MPETVRDALRPDQPVGPLLFCRGWHDGRLRLAALVAEPAHARTPDLMADGTRVTPEPLHHRAGYRVVRYRFELTAGPDSGYELAGLWYPVETEWRGDLRLAYVSCNGQEQNDRERTRDERNRLWQRLERQHEDKPLHLLLHGGDQLYADEMLELEPALARWAAHETDHDGDRAATPELADVLADYLFERYLEVYSQGAVSRLMSSVPSLSIWDDHDICDGWGSRPAEQLDSAIGRLIFRTARAQYLLFQMASGAADPPGICPDSSGATLSWRVQMPGLLLVAPDLRSERRPDRILGPRGHEVLRRMLTEAAGGRILMLSSVPVLGPRLSWVERLLTVTPHAQKYEDDLRDQWQSRAHRAEWRELLELLLRVHGHASTAVTLLSGEIHLATRATLTTAAGDLHQLVSSGIAHPPPPALYARLLGVLAWLGEAPLPEHPIRLWPLPGRRQIYTAQRNYLLLERRAGCWYAHWELEHDGATDELGLD